MKSWNTDDVILILFLDCESLCIYGKFKGARIHITYIICKHIHQISRAKFSLCSDLISLVVFTTDVDSHKHSQSIYQIVVIYNSGNIELGYLDFYVNLD